MSKYLKIRYKDGYETENGIEYIPKEITIPVHEENEFVILRFTKESFTDIIAIAKIQGLDIKLEEK